MNKQIKELVIQADKYANDICDTDANADWYDTRDEKFAQLIVAECVSILETEIELVQGYKSTAFNDFDIKWHEGKIEHFTELIEKCKKHFGVKE
jgi:hypothetical protein